MLAHLVLAGSLAAPWSADHKLGPAARLGDVFSPPDSYTASLSFHLPYIPFSEPVSVVVDSKLGGGSMRLSYYSGLDTFIRILENPPVFTFTWTFDKNARPTFTVFSPLKISDHFPSFHLSILNWNGARCVHRSAQNESRLSLATFEENDISTIVSSPPNK